MTVTINGTTGIAGTNGSAGTPAVQGEDTNTGIFFPAADTVAVATGGTERLRVDSSGNLLVGTASQYGSQKLSLNGGIAIDGRSAATPGLSEKGDDNTGVFWPAADSLGFSTGGTERARIDSIGRLFLGKSASDISTAGWELSPGGGGSLIGTVSSGTNEVFTFGNTSTSGTAQVDFRTANVEKGSISWNNSTTTYATSSDYRLKENVAPMQNALDTVAQLNPVTYTWKADGSAGQGFIAHELQAVVPDCVTGEKDAVDETGNPQYQGVDTSFLVATLVKAIQELTARVAQLEAQ